MMWYYGHNINRQSHKVMRELGYEETASPVMADVILLHNARKVQAEEFSIAGPFKTIIITGSAPPLFNSPSAAFFQDEVICKKDGNTFVYPNVSITHPRHYLRRRK